MPAVSCQQTLIWMTHGCESNTPAAHEHSLLTICCHSNHWQTRDFGTVVLAAASQARSVRHATPFPHAVPTGALCRTRRSRLKLPVVRVLVVTPPLGACQSHESLQICEAIMINDSTLCCLAVSGLLYTRSTPPRSGLDTYGTHDSSSSTSILCTLSPPGPVLPTF